MKSLLLSSALCLAGFNVFAQNVGIGTNTPDASAKLEILDANRGILIPRVSLTATNAATPVSSPATGLLIYNIATASSGTTAVSPGFYYWNGSAWVRFAAGNAGWELTGNANTNIATNFIGTTDANAVVFRTNNVERMRIDATGKIGIGTTSPQTSLHIQTATANTGFRLADGSQGANKVLTSDANGNATWAINSSTVVLGTLSTTAKTITNTAGDYTGSYITLPPGKWLVTASMLIPQSSAEFWVRSSFSDSPSSSAYTSDIIGSFFISGFKNAGAYGTVSGAIVINNTTAGNKSYYYWALSPDVYSGTYSMPNYGTALWNENQLYAIPIK